MIQITVTPELRQRCPDFVGTAVVASVCNSDSSPALWQEIDRFIADYRQRYTVDSLKQMPSIQATREAYRRCGKDPSRYRPSGEALVRRTLQGKDLYRVDTLVDLINLASIAFGYSIGGFDADKIASSTVHSAPASASGDFAAGIPPSATICQSEEPSPKSPHLFLGIGREDEPYEGIGRGPLNIAGLPVYRDALGGIGTPTSDHERTKLTLRTTHLLAIVNGYDGNRQGTTACATYLQQLLRSYAASDGGQLIQF